LFPITLLLLRNVRYNSVELADPITRDAAQNPSEAGRLINFAAFGSFHQALGNCNGFFATLRSSKHQVFPANDHLLGRSLCCVFVSASESRFHDMESSLRGVPECVEWPEWRMIF